MRRGDLSAGIRSDDVRDRRPLIYMENTKWDSLLRVQRHARDPKPESRIRHHRLRSSDPSTAPYHSLGALPATVAGRGQLGFVTGTNCESLH